MSPSVSLSTTTRQSRHTTVATTISIVWKIVENPNGVKKRVYFLLAGIFAFIQQPTQCCFQLGVVDWVVGIFKHYRRLAFWTSPRAALKRGIHLLGHGFVSQPTWRRFQAGRRRFLASTQKVKLVVEVVLPSGFV